MLRASFLAPVLAPVLALMLAACAGQADTTLSRRKPGLDIADVALANGAPGTALHVAQQALAADPDNAAALLRAASAYAALGQRDEAARCFGRVLALSPDDADAALGFGRLMLATDPAASETVLARLAARRPDNVAALTDLGIARDLLGKHEAAQTAYRQALAVDPGRVAATVNLGLSLALSGDTGQALALLRPIALGTGVSPRIRQDLAAALALAGDSEEAADLLLKDMPQPQAVAAVAGYRALIPSP